LEFLGQVGMLLGIVCLCDPAALFKVFEFFFSSNYYFLVFLDYFEVLMSKNNFFKKNILF
jgi:hypothetical protein